MDFLFIREIAATAEQYIFFLKSPNSTIWNYGNQTAGGIQSADLKTHNAKGLPNHLARAGWASIAIGLVGPTH